MQKGKRVATDEKATLYSSKKSTSRSDSPKSKKRKGSLLRTLAIALGSVAFLVVGVVVAWNLVIKPPPLPNVAINSGEYPSQDPDQVGVPSISQQPSQPPANPYLPVDVNNTNIRTFLAVATYDGSNTDTIMLGAVNIKTHEVNVVSIPRDTAIQYKNRRDKINAVFARSKAGDTQACIDALAAELSNIIGFVPNTTMFIKASAFKKIVDAVGGVPFTIPQTIYKANENINLKAGTYNLTGEQALMLCRFRGYGSNNKAGIPHDDLGRMYMQQQFLKAAAKKILVPANIFKFDDFAKIFKENVTTNLKTTEILWYAEELTKTISGDLLTFNTLPTTSVDKSYEYIVVDEALEMLNAYVNPYSQPITKEMLNLSYKSEK
jgi:LCP family protein required for cell wall assembly